MTVYVDLLLCYNLLVHFCLLSSTAALCMEKVRKGRILLASLFGSVTSFAIFLNFNALEFMLFKTVTAVSLILITFGFGQKTQFIKRLLLFLAVNFVYAGVMYAIAFSFAPSNMIYRSGVAYFGSKTVTYVGGLLAAYFLLKIGVWWLSRKKGSSSFHTVQLACGEKTAVFRALYDSGNRMIDLYSGKGVLLLSPTAAERILPKEVLPFFIEGEDANALRSFGHQARLLPLNTASGCGMVGAFMPDEVMADGVRYDWCIAVARQEFTQGVDALLPASF